GASGPKRSEIGQGGAVQPANEGRREPVAELGVPWHRAGCETARQPRPEDDVCLAFLNRIDEPIQLARPVAVVPVEEDDDVGDFRGREAGQAGPAVSAPGLDDDPGPQTGGDLPGPVR